MADFVHMVIRSPKFETVAKLNLGHCSLEAGEDSPSSCLMVGAYLNCWIEGEPGCVEQPTTADPRCPVDQSQCVES